MKSAILLLALFTLIFTSCSTAYQTGQTPDDVYYSKAPKREEYAKVEKEEDRRYQYTDDYYDDRYLRMKVSNRYRWNDLNDWYYYERYGFGYNYIYGSYYNPYNSWNYYYNPFCCCHGSGTGFGGGYGNPKTIAYKPLVKPRVFNLNSYNNTAVNNSNGNSTRPVRTVATGRSSTTEKYNNNNRSNRGLGNTIRNIISGNDNNYSNSNSSSNSSSSSNSTRTYTPSNNSSSSSSGSSSGSSGSSGGGVSRPSRN